MERPKKNTGLRDPAVKGKAAKGELVTPHGSRHEHPDEGRRYKDKGSLPKSTMMRGAREMYRGAKTGSTDEHSSQFQRLPGTGPSPAGDSVS